MHTQPDIASRSTFCLIKPDAIERRVVSPIFSRIESQFQIVQMEFIKNPSLSLVIEHYREHCEKPFFNTLVDFITHGEVIAMELLYREWWHGVSGIDTLRGMIGAVGTQIAGTIRGDFHLPNEPLYRNLIHGSDSKEAYERETRLWFGSPRSGAEIRPRQAERYEDMSPRGRMLVQQQEDGDMILTVIPDPDSTSWAGSSVEFCTRNGGGRSPHTRRALQALKAAIELDNKETPDWRANPPAPTAELHAYVVGIWIEDGAINWDETDLVIASSPEAAVRLTYPDLGDATIKQLIGGYHEYYQVKRWEQGDALVNNQGARLVDDPDELASVGIEP